MSVGQLWAQEAVRDGVLSLYKRRGAHTPADLCTKHIDRAKVEHYLRLLRVRAEAGRASTAPALTAEVQPFLATSVSGQ